MPERMGAVARWRENVWFIRRWWRDPEGVLSVKRRPFTTHHLPSELLKILTDDPEAREYVMEELKAKERRDRREQIGLRAVR